MIRRIAFALIAVTMITFTSFSFSHTRAAENDAGLDATIVGMREFFPGITAVLQITVQNNNTIDKIDAAAVQAELSQYYGAAVSLTARLEEGTAPIAVKTEEVLLGTLPVGQATPPVPFTIEVDENAKSGVYQVSLLLTYKRLVSTTAEGYVGGEGFARIEPDWSENETEVELLEIEIEEEKNASGNEEEEDEELLEFEITSIEADLQPGVRKEIKAVFKNLGDESARDSVAKVSADAPLSLTDNTAFLGTLQPGDSAVGIFGLKVAGDAIVKEYALDAFIRYTDDDGDEHISEKLKVPVKVSPTSRISGLISSYSSYLVSGLVGAGFMAIIWFISYLVAEARRRKAD